MNIPNITGLMKVGKTFILANRPEILFGASITATLASVVMAAKGGYEARGIVDAEQARREHDVDDAGVVKEGPLTSKEKIQLTWLCYMPAAVTTIGALGSTTGLHIVHVKDKKMLAQAALSAIEEVKTSAKEFEKEHTLGVLSNDEKQKILEERAERVPIGEKLDSHIENSDGIVEPMYLVRDARTGRDIWSNDHRIEDALIEVNNVINGSGDCEINHFYNHAGFASIPDGTQVGWSGALVSLEWTETRRDDGRPVRVFTFRPTPEKGYDRSGMA